MMGKIDVWSTKSREIMEGYYGRFVHSERTTHVYWEIDPGKPLPEHDHPHEPVSYTHLTLPTILLV